MNVEVKQKIRFHTMAILLIIIFCIAITPKTLQNDTFYTIEIGKYILENGITMQEPFAWHEGLEYTFPHWAYDVFIYFVYSIGGMTGIYISTMVLASILGIIMYVINVKLVKNRTISFGLTIITLYLLKPYICARAQLVTFILFILTIYFIEQFLGTKKIKYAIGLIIIPILIANLHLATFYFYFILYLPYIAEYIMYILAYCNVIISKSVVEKIEKSIAKKGKTEELCFKLERAKAKYNRLKSTQDKKMLNSYKVKIEYNKNIKLLVIIAIICALTGFLTPLGTTPYTYLIKTMQGISTKNITEHLPLVLAENIKALLVFIVYIASLMLTKVKIRLSDLFMIAGLTLLAILSSRQCSMLYVIGVIILNRIITSILNQHDENKITKIDNYSSKTLGIIIISIIVIIASLVQYKQKKNDEYIDSSSYPVQAATWIKENLDLSNIKIYNEYNWGSYLLYQGIPVFVDSRCDLYMPEFNEDTYVFEDFLNLYSLNVKNVSEIIEKYDFTHFVVKSNTRLRWYLEDHSENYKKIYPVEDAEDDRFFTIYERIK